MRHQTRVSLESRWLQRPELWWLTLLVTVEAAGLVGYLLLSNTGVESVRYLLYPFVWINVGVVGVVHVTPRATSRRAQTVAGILAGLYFLVLAGLAGLVSVDLAGLLGTAGHHGHSHAHAHVHGLQVTMTVPGWGPRVGYAGAGFTVNLVPFRVIGYLALAYLVYAALCDLAGAAVSGVLGLGSCLSCTLPIAGSLSAGLVGGAGVVAALSALSVDLSTAVFVGSVLLLAFRPSIGGAS
ncbi:hypothetical protein C2R22_03070 [Salinigranum rubrum]|uniref:Uncharacterized protein n=1 Tax=Salinigranum rubrum TaxID=755307 RepID=A0A2I8VFS6_9EURY|nr:hypothetical protein [Salinigranum rubrum]AUV80761.1 hypothetical protein C2R22_03070 [Salinigranum rubrum]